MARRRKYTQAKTKSKPNSKYTDGQKLAFEMGKIQRSLNENPDSLVSESFENGYTFKDKKTAEKRSEY